MFDKEQLISTDNFSYIQFPNHFILHFIPICSRGHTDMLSRSYRYAPQVIPICSPGHTDMLSTSYRYVLYFIPICGGAKNRKIKHSISFLEKNAPAHSGMCESASSTAFGNVYPIFRNHGSNRRYDRDRITMCRIWWSPLLFIFIRFLGTIMV